VDKCNPQMYHYSDAGAPVLHACMYHHWPHATVTHARPSLHQYCTACMYYHWPHATVTHARPSLHQYCTACMYHHWPHATVTHARPSLTTFTNVSAFTQKIMRADALVALRKRFVYDARPDLAGNLTAAGKYELGQVLAAVSGLANRDSPRFFYLWGECSLLGVFALPAYLPGRS
jgi:hypothetical protein